MDCINRQIRSLTLAVQALPLTWQSVTASRISSTSSATTLAPRCSVPCSRLDRTSLSCPYPFRTTKERNSTQDQTEGAQ